MKDKCEYEGCEEEAVGYAQGAFDWPGMKHDEVRKYCLEHQNRVSAESVSEFIATCPNCGCMFGVN